MLAYLESHFPGKCQGIGEELPEEPHGLSQHRSPCLSIPPPLPVTVVTPVCSRAVLSFTQGCPLLLLSPDRPCSPSMGRVTFSIWQMHCFLSVLDPPSQCPVSPPAVPWSPFRSHTLHTSALSPPVCPPHHAAAHRAFLPWALHLAEPKVSSQVPSGLTHKQHLSQLRSLPSRTLSPRHPHMALCGQSLPPSQRPFLSLGGSSLLSDL